MYSNGLDPGCCSDLCDGGDLISLLFATFLRVGAMICERGFEENDHKA